MDAAPHTPASGTAGAPPQPVQPAETDALIVGAGPVGLFQVFQLGLLEVKAHVVDSLPYAGGQCIELYADKPIYDIPSVLMCTGRQLVDNLLAQIKPFNTDIHLEQEVSWVRARDDGRFDVATSSGQRFIARSIIVAGGVGSFQPRRLKVDGIEVFEAKQLFHRVPQASHLAGLDIVIQGDGDAALQAAIQCATSDSNRPRSVTLVHRRDVFTAEADTVAEMRRLCTSGAMRLAIGQITAFEVSATDAARLSHLKLMGPDGTETLLPVDTLLVLLGLSPKLGPIAQWGLALERKQVVVDTEAFETSVPGIFAIGD
ncbi:MAG: thioredoxin reductase, partial [Rhizobacter sp.]|nr:thioredoxin reductase [Rhizobacter sp.]